VSRMTLSLPGRAAAPKADARPAAWKCKICGLTFTLDDVAEGEAVRCPKCTSNLGKREGFLSDPPSPKLRARPAKLRPPPAPAGPVVIKTRPKAVVRPTVRSG